MFIKNKPFKREIIVKENCNFENCTFSNSVKIYSTEVRFINCIFSNIQKEAIYVTHSNCTLSRCTIELNGDKDIILSQIYAEDSKVSIDNCNIMSSVNANGVETHNSILYINNSLFENNEFEAIFAENSEVQINNSVFKNNCLNKESSTQIILAHSKSNFANSLIEKSEATGLSLFSCNVSINNSKICFNKLGGIKVSEKSFLNITNSTLNNNKNSDEDSFCIWIEESESCLNKSILSNNKCAIYTQKGSYSKLEECIFNNNEKNLCLFEFSKIELLKTDIDEKKVNSDDSSYTLISPAIDQKIKANELNREKDINWIIKEKH